MLEPWGAVRDDMHASRIEAMLYNINRAKGSNAMRWHDLCYKDKWQRADEKATDLHASVRAFIRANNEVSNG